MQSVTWYGRRLRSMSLDEFMSRTKSTLRDAIDRSRIALGLFPSLAVDDAFVAQAAAPPGFRVSDVAVGAWVSPNASPDEAAWCRRLLREADRIASHRLSFLGLKDRHVGDPIDWNRDHASGRLAPMRFAPSIDYRDFRVTGDAKLVWELNRHHHLVVLARAYRASADAHYAQATIAQLESWLRQCPFPMGMNWRSPLELAIRLINWVWIIDLVRDSALFKDDVWARLVRACELHVWEITRNYSQGSSANNHLIGEAAGVYVAATYFPGLRDASFRRGESRQILIREIAAQTYGEGCSRELALGYHLFVLQFFLVAGIVARSVGDDFPAAYWAQLERMLEFVGVLVEGGGSAPMFGDSDDGYVLDLGDSTDRAAALLSVGASIFRRADFKAWAGRYTESARWLLGHSSRAQFDATPTPPESPLTSRGFPDSGHYLLQCGGRAADDRVSVLFDCGELGFKSIAAHGHADVLSFTLRAFGRDIFVDPGTYDYFSYPAWRDYFRSTRAHNALVVDDSDQSIMLGPFLWGARANARCVRWEPRGQGGSVTGEHDGYTRLADPVVHRRTLELDAQTRALTIRDEIIARGTHRVAIYFHLSDDCSVAQTGPHRSRITVNGRTVALELDSRLTVRMLRGSDEPIGGWVSRAYHEKSPATTIVASGTCVGSTSFLCRIETGLPVGFESTINEDNT